MNAPEKIQFGMCIAMAGLLFVGWALTLADGLIPRI
jgi:hypothetical protein